MSGHGELCQCWGKEMDSLLECGSLWELFMDQELPWLRWDLEGLVDLSRGNASPGSDEIPAVSVSGLICAGAEQSLCQDRFNSC